MGENYQRVTVKPAPGLVIFDPNGVKLPDEGKEVNLDTFWFRRLEQGDCVRVTEPKVEPSEIKRAAKSAAKKEIGGTEQ